MIVDCHGHYTTAPKQLEDYRNRQIAELKDDPAHAASAWPLRRERPRTGPRLRKSGAVLTWKG